MWQFARKSGIREITMNTNRLEAFSDGVIAIIITIMVLEFKVPHGAQWQDLMPLWPVFISYVLSFVYVGIYWNNHHHLFHLVQSINGRVLWANLNFLFWLSLLPFTTGWMGENHFAPTPMALYCFDLLMCAVSSFLLTRAIFRHEGPGSALKAALGDSGKGKISLISSALAVPLALVGYPVLSGLLVTAVAAMWLVPERRIERAIEHHEA